MRMNDVLMNDTNDRTAPLLPKAATYRNRQRSRAVSRSFRRSVVEGDLEQIHLLAPQVDVNEAPEESCCCMFVPRCLRRRAPWNRPGQTPLYLASKYGHVDVVNYLARDCRADIHKARPNGIDPMVAAAYRGHEEVVTLLQQIAKETEDGGSTRTPERTRVRYHGMKAGQLPEELLARYRRKQKKKTKTTKTAARGKRKTKEGDTHGSGGGASRGGGRRKGRAGRGHVRRATDPGPLDLKQAQRHLRHACRKGDLKYTKVITGLAPKGGGPADFLDWTPSEGAEKGQTALYVAARFGHADLVQFLFDQGADPARPDAYTWAPVLRAAQEGHADVCRVLVLACGADVNAQEPNEGWTPMIAAAFHGHVDVVETLGVECNADADITNTKGLTACHIAAFTDNPEVVKVLVLKCKSDILYREPTNNWTPTDIAMSKRESDGGHEVLCAFLKQQEQLALERRCAEGKRDAEDAAATASVAASATSAADVIVGSFVEELDDGGGGGGGGEGDGVGGGSGSPHVIAGDPHYLPARRASEGSIGAKREETGVLEDSLTRRVQQKELTRRRSFSVEGGRGKRGTAPTLGTRKLSYGLLPSPGK